MKIYVVLLLVLVSGCSSLPETVHNPADGGGLKTEKIFVVSHGWHTGIVYPRESLINAIPELGARFPNGQYLELGWGDKGFYEANEITTLITLRAIFWPTESVVHVVSVPDSPYISFSNSEIRELRLSTEKIHDLGVFLSNSFKRDPQGNVIPTKNGIYGDSQFYTGEGTYYLFNTCNKWTAKGLQSAGFDINPMFKLTASSIINFIDENEKLNKALHLGQPDAERLICQ